jgi:hypothetical protein
VVLTHTGQWVAGNGGSAGAVFVDQIQTQLSAVQETLEEVCTLLSPTPSQLPSPASAVSPSALSSGSASAIASATATATPNAECGHCQRTCTFHSSCSITESCTSPSLTINAPAVHGYVQVLLHNDGLDSLHRRMRPCRVPKPRRELRLKRRCHGVHAHVWHVVPPSLRKTLHGARLRRGLQRGVVLLFRRAQVSTLPRGVRGHRQLSGVQRPVPSWHIRDQWLHHMHPVF